MSQIIGSVVAATRTLRSRLGLLTLLFGLGLGLGIRASASVTTITTLADQPVFATNTVPGNMAFTLSVEFPTAISVANLGDYSDSTTYLGYFDPAKCYSYQYNSTIPASSYFAPAAFSTGSNGHSCSAKWSGNFMNWATMQTIDPFRWVLTGGYRSVDTTSQTILEKAWGASEGGTNNFPYRGTTQPSGNNIAQSLIAKVTPLTTWPQFNTGIWGNGNTMLVGRGDRLRGIHLPNERLRSAIQRECGGAHARPALLDGGCRTLRPTSSRTGSTSGSASATPPSWAYWVSKATARGTAPRAAAARARSTPSTSQQG